jgi:hypothetical protein
LACLARLQLLDVIPACVSNTIGKPSPIYDVLSDIAANLSALSDALCDSYLNHAVMPRALASAAPGEGAT